MLEAIKYPEAIEILRKMIKTKMVEPHKTIIEIK